MDKITLRDVRAFGRHGANPGERDEKQAFDLEVALELDLRAPSASDDLRDTVNYDALHVRLVEIVESTSFYLLERLCAELVEAIFDDPRVARAEVTIAKPDILDGTTPAITLARENPRYRSAFP